MASFKNTIYFKVYSREKAKLGAEEPKAAKKRRSCSRVLRS